jgi:hypothetical protein
VFHKTIIAVTAAVALGCVPVAPSALAADHPGGGHSGGHAVSGHAMSGHAMSGHAMGGHAKGGYARSGHGARYGGGYYGGGGPIYDSCDSYYGNGCPGFGIPLVGGLINGALGGY